MVSAIILALLFIAVDGLHFNYNRNPAQVLQQNPGVQLLQATASGNPFSNFLPYNPPERLSVAGFGPSTAYGSSSTSKISFSNPPPSLGSTTDLASQTCGLAPPFCVKSKYRTIDGSCNNLLRPSWGMPQNPYGRLVPYNYADGIYEVTRSQSGRPLPNARSLSFVLFPDKHLVDPFWSLNTQQWGQIVTHDMSLTSGVVQSHKDPIVCCSDDGQLTQMASTNPSCAPLIVPPNDPIHSPQRTQCMNFVRTATTRDRGCTPPNAPAEPLSAVTAYMDLSLVYGSSASQAAPIRAGQGGRLLTVEREGREWPPQDPNITVTCESAQSPNEPCYLAGDARVNQNPQLTVLQVILLREHNRIADTLAKLNPHWNDETIFQEARRIHVAEFQHINYYEYLPILLGYENMKKNKLIYPGVHGYVNDYNPNVDPSVLDEHATAAFRHFHTLIRGYLKLITELREIHGIVRLSDWFNRPLLLELGDSFDELARGLATQEQDFSDQFWDSEITQFLFKRNNTFGGDLRATDIQRGRDHGLGSYKATRAACGLSVPNTFHDMLASISQEVIPSTSDYLDTYKAMEALVGKGLTRSIGVSNFNKRQIERILEGAKIKPAMLQNVEILKSFYESPDDVDLVVGGSLEINVPGALTGPTFLCILTEQFYRTRVGDRFFYENGADSTTAFTPSQLETIRRGSSMARLLCDNGDRIEHMQPRAFQLISHSNKLVPCEELPFVDLTLWQDARGLYKK